MYDPVTARFLQADTYAGNINDPLSLNLYTYCLNNPHKYVDPSGHVPIWAIEIFRVVTAAISAFFSGKAEYDRQKELGYNEIDWMAVRNVVEFDFLLSYATFGVGSKAVKGASIGAKYFLKQLGKAVAKDAAIGFVVDAGRETARQLATGTKLTNLDFDRIKDAGMVGGIIGGVSTVAGAAAEGIANTKFAKNAISKFKNAAGKGVNAIKSSFAKIASMNGKKTGMDAVEKGRTTLNDWVNRVFELSKKAPIEIPADATVKFQEKNGYDQINFKWTKDGQNYEVRWHTKTPGAPEGQGNTWVVSRVTPGTPTGQVRTEHILVGEAWIPRYQWQDAIYAYRKGIATDEQLKILKDGHWQAP